VKLPLRHVLDLPRRDVAVYEHKRTGERRNVTGKERATYGLDEAWQRAKPKKAAPDTTGQTDVVS
jgi:hypothetical protein